MTITGIDFQPIAGSDSVFFNGKLAQLVSVSDTQLIAIVPTLSGTGNVIVKANGKTTNAGKFGYDTTYRLSMVADTLQGAFYLSLDLDGNLYVPSYGQPYIYKITPQGILSNWLNISGVIGNVVDSAGNLYFSQNVAGNTRFGKISPAGMITQVAVDSGSNNYQIALDRNGNLYAPMMFNNNGEGRIDKITPDGQISKIADSLFSPSGVVVTSDGTIYCTNYSVMAYDGTKGVITKVSPTGVVSTFAHIRYGGYAGLTLDANNTLYVTNFDQMYELGSVIRFTPDGVGTQLISANINFPCGLVRDPNGNFYVVQTNDAAGVPFGSVVKMTMH